MSVTIYNAISLDGYISGPDKFEDWISAADEQYFDEVCQEADLIIMGSNTFDLNPELYPVPNKHNVVFTQTAATRDAVDGIEFSDQDPGAFCAENKEQNIMVAGGGILNASLLKSGVVTDIFVSVHPVVLGAGIRQFEGVDFTNMTNLKKVSEKDIGDDVVLIHYQVV